MSTTCCNLLKYSRLTAAEGKHEIKMGLQEGNDQNQKPEKRDKKAEQIFQFVVVWDLVIIIMPDDNSTTSF